MDNEQKFWLIIWIIIALSIVSIFGIVSNYYNERSEKINAIVGLGYSPIEALCGVSSNGNEPVCVSIVSQKNKDK